MAANSATSMLLAGLTRYQQATQPKGTLMPRKQNRAIGDQISLAKDKIASAYFQLKQTASPLDARKYREAICAAANLLATTGVDYMTARAQLMNEFDFPISHNGLMLLPEAFAEETERYSIRDDGLLVVELHDLADYLSPYRDYSEGWSERYTKGMDMVFDIMNSAPDKFACWDYDKPWNEDPNPAYLECDARLAARVAGVQVWFRHYTS